MRNFYQFLWIVALIWQNGINQVNESQVVELLLGLQILLTVYMKESWIIKSLHDYDQATLPFVFCSFM